MQKAEMQKPLEWTWNILEYFQSQIPHDLDRWPQNQKGASLTHAE